MRIKTQFAPRLVGGDARVPVYAAWPDDIKEGLRAIARSEHKSMNWVLEEVVTDYFHLRRPNYVKPARRLVRSKVVQMVPRKLRRAS